MNKLRKARGAPLLLAVVAASGSALAQTASGETENQDAHLHDVIVVTATRTEQPITAIPNTVKVLNKETIEQQLAVSASLLDSLGFSIPSLTPARQKLTSSGVTLRGRTPLYLVDGIPQSTPLRNGERSGFTIDPAFIDRVEVIYGANAIQGVGATGGVINTVTVAPPKSGEPLFRLLTALTTDDFGDDGFHYRFAGLAGKSFGAFDGLVGAALEKRGLYYDGGGKAVAVDPVQGDLTDSLSGNVFAKFGYDLDADKRLEFAGNYFKLEGDGDYLRIAGDRQAGLPATSLRGDPPGDPTYNKAVNLALSYRDEDLAGGKLSLAGYYYDFYALYGGDTFGAFQDASIAPLGALFDQSALASEKYGVKLTYVRENIFWPGLQVALGGDYLHDETYQELAQTDRIWVPKMQFKGYAPFVQVEQALLEERLRLSGGARWENVALTVPDFTTIASANSTFVQGGAPDFDKLLGNIGVVVEPLDGLTLYSSFTQGFTMPDAGLILRAVNTPGQSVDTLVDLKPVVADNIEIGAAFRRDGFDFAASYFWSNSDFGSRIQVVNGAGQIRRERTEISGFEISGGYRFASGFGFGANYAALQGVYDSDGDDAVDRDLDGRNISPDRLNAYVEGPLAGHFWGRLQSSTFFDRKFKGGLPEHDFEGYTIVDLLLSYHADRAGDFTLGVQNVFDKRYLTYYSQTVTFVNDTTFVSGRGRALSLTWKYDF